MSAPSQPPILTSIVATIGPACDTPELVRRLIVAGVSVFRFNFSHGDLEAHERRLSVVRAVSQELGIPVACLGDLQGPKIRVGRVPAGVGAPHPSGGGSIRVEAGQDVVLKRDIEAAFIRAGKSGEEAVLPLTYQQLVDEVQPGHRVLINDGAIRMLSLERDGEAGELRCRVTEGGIVSSGKGINLPDSRLSTPAITERDWECAAWAVRHSLDFLALSFVRDATDVRQLRDGIANMCGADKPARPAGSVSEGAWIPIISKIEMPQALVHLDAIVAESDGIMVARGDLGVEMNIETVPIAQKRIVRACRDFGKPCIVATQMLESMIENAGPTRAEATDVANAIFDGTDAVMLSAETATGKHPITVVETMVRIIHAAEDALLEMPPTAMPPTRMLEHHRGTAALAHGAWQIAKDLKAKLVVCWSQHGGTARYLSQNRFTIPIVAFSSDLTSTRQMTLLRGVTPVLAAPPASGKLSDWNLSVDRLLVDRQLAQTGETIVLIAGKPLGEAKRTNTLTIHNIGDTTGFTSHG